MKQNKKLNGPLWSTNISHTYVCKNKLQEDVYQLLKSYDRVLFADFDSLKIEISNKITTLNALHSKCKPIECHWYSNFNSNHDCSLSIPGICSFNIHELKVIRTPLTHKEFMALQKANKT